MITETERKNRDELFRLMQENPELPVVPMVDSEIVADDSWAWWIGSWGTASIQEYWVGETVYFREDDNWDEVYEAVYDKFFHRKDTGHLSDEEKLELYRSIPWVKAIIVYIDLPKCEEVEE